MIDKEFSQEVNKHFQMWGDMAVKSMQDSFEQLKRIQEEALKMQMQAKFDVEKPENPKKESD